MKLDKLNIMIKNFLTGVVNDPQRKSLLQITFEYLKFLLTDKKTADQYFHNHFYRKGPFVYSDYLLTSKLMHKCWKINDPVYTSILDNKYLIEMYFSQHKINIVKGFGHNINSLFITPNKIIQINSLSEFVDFLTPLVKNVSKTKSIFIKKNENSWGGKGVFRISLGDLNGSAQKMEEIFNTVRQSGYIFQDTVIQHEQLNQLNPCCINTLRIDTYTNRQNVSKVYSSFIRLGVGKSHVDNISSGGIYVGIDMENGTLYAESFSDFTHGKGKSFKLHPDTGFTFEGFQIPFYEEAKKLALEAAQKIPQIKVIGWDIAIQPDGPIIIEGNERPGIDFSEVSQMGFKNNPVFLELLKEAEEITY